MHHCGRRTRGKNKRNRRRRGDIRSSRRRGGRKDCIPLSRCPDSVGSSTCKCIVTSFIRSELCIIFIFSQIIVFTANTDNSGNSAKVKSHDSSASCGSCGLGTSQDKQWGISLLLLVARLLPLFMNLAVSIMSVAGAVMSGAGAIMSVVGAIIGGLSSKAVEVARLLLRFLKVAVLTVMSLAVAVVNWWSSIIGFVRCLVLLFRYVSFALENDKIKYCQSNHLRAGGRGRSTRSGASDADWERTCQGYQAGFGGLLVAGSIQQQAFPFSQGNSNACAAIAMYAAIQYALTPSLLCVQDEDFRHSATSVGRDIAVETRFMHREGAGSYIMRDQFEHFFSGFIENEDYVVCSEISGDDIYSYIDNLTGHLPDGSIHNRNVAISEFICRLHI